MTKCPGLPLLPAVILTRLTIHYGMILIWRVYCNVTKQFNKPIQNVICSKSLDFSQCWPIEINWYLCYLLAVMNLSAANNVNIGILYLWYFTHLIIFHYCSVPCGEKGTNSLSKFVLGYLLFLQIKLGCGSNFYLTFFSMRFREEFTILLSSIFS